MFWNILRRTMSEWNEHNAFRLSAAMAFYALLSLAPLVVFAIMVVGLVFGHTAAQAQIIAEARYTIGSQGADLVRGLLESQPKRSAGIVASIFGIVTVLFGASGVFIELRDSLNTMWDVKPHAALSVWTLMKERFATFGMVMAVGFLLLVSFAVSAVTALLGSFFSATLPMPEFVLHILSGLISFAAIAVLFALIFKYVPDARIDWKDVWLGALFTSFLFTLGKLLIGLYLGKTAVGSAYGAAGSVIAVTVWVYYSSLIFFFGAEFTHELAVHKPEK